MNTGGFSGGYAAAAVAVFFVAAGAVTAAVVNKQHGHGTADIVKIVPDTKLAMRVDPGHVPVKTTLAFPTMNAESGMRLFASKGCVACHAINGVGGHDATKLDAHAMDRVMHPFDFVARMWTMAPAMIQAQEEGLGHQILFTGEEIADIIAFVHDDGQQHKFTEAAITAEVRKMMNHSHSARAPQQKKIGHGH